ncbi:MAG: DUF4194 domain-containing protein [gamma proteobacterium endosymbiont of Lamellibrachia anaximandri]|nr:DUF4194 domain-containing protein [gamma proteobacterium endosymbiont of Lamellibrachia anaximandri]MBL3617611.1 DUF4194 domain-containing protein [gamma proteobacterium endosymbiont of Lamellibrachia anaximandri]
MSEEQPTPLVEGTNDGPALSDSQEVTPQSLKSAVQELLKYGVLEADHKPNLYRIALISFPAVNAILEPLDMAMKIDDIRGIAYLAIVENYADSEKDEWSHPLVRRQRLNLEQSLLVAILRRIYIAHEMESGIGTKTALAHLDELMPELNQFLGETGSDSRNDKRLRQLLEQLRGHGLVSEVDKNDQLTIRPLIVHIANPENLQNLLAAFKQQVKAQQEPGE